MVAKDGRVVSLLCPTTERTALGSSGEARIGVRHRGTHRLQRDRDLLPTPIAAEGATRPESGAVHPDEGTIDVATRSRSVGIDLAPGSRVAVEAPYEHQHLEVAVDLTDRDLQHVEPVRCHDIGAAAHHNADRLPIAVTPFGDQRDL